MSAPTAVKAAIDLVQVPSRARYQQSSPLPSDVVTVLRIAAGDKQALSEASKALDRSPALIHKAAVFFIEQILLHPAADSYRVLGASGNATASELRHNMALVLRCLHPDANPQYDRSIFARRVTQAWEDLKTPERRAAYDKVRRAQTINSRKRTKAGTRPQSRRYAASRNLGIWREERKGLLHRAFLLLLAGARSRRT